MFAGREYYVLKPVLVFKRKAAGVSRQLFVRLSFVILICIFYTPVVYSHADLQLQIDHLTEQLELQPDNVDLLLRRGDLQRRHGNWVPARLDFENVRKIQPDNITVDWFEGRMEVESGHPEVGVRYLDRFLLSKPGHLIALQNRAQGNLLLGKALLAAQDYATVIEKSDKPSPALFSANALALIKAGPENYPSAMEVVKKGLLRFPLEASLTGIGTDLSLAQSDINVATELINKLPAAIQKLPQWVIRKALLDCLSGFQADAVAGFSHVLETLGSRQRSSYLSEEWLQRLSKHPSPEACQSAVAEVLEDSGSG